MFLFSKPFKKKSSPKRMYVIVRGDLSTEYRMVQGAHALAQLLIDNPDVNFPGSMSAGDFPRNFQLALGYHSANTNIFQMRSRHDNTGEWDDWVSLDLLEWKNKYLIFLKARNLKALVSLYYKLQGQGYKISKFNGPDLNDHVTAIALYTEVDNPLIKHLPLAWENI